MKKIFTFAAALLFSVGMMATELFSFTVTSATTAAGTYAEGAAVLNPGMATGGTNEVTVGTQTFYKFNTSTKWTFNLDEELQEDDVITLTVAANASQEKKGKGVIINGKTLTAASIPAGGTATITYTVVAEDGIAGTKKLEMTRADSDIKFGTIVITGDHTPVTKYTVTYMDGETELGTEKVIEGENATNASSFEAKAHATFDGWFNEADFQTAADFTAAITADKTFYGKWTAIPFTASTSVNIEQGVLDNSTKWDIEGAFTAAHIAYANIDALDSLSTKAGRNEPYLGLKLKTAGAYVEVALNADDELKVKFGHIENDIKVNGTTVAVADIADGVYTYTATEQGYVRIETTTGKTLVLKQIMINEEIKNVVLPDTPTAIDNIEAAKAIKVIENGQIVIIKNGVRYNAVGAKL